MSPEMVRYLSAALGTVLLLAAAMKVSDGGAFAAYLGGLGAPQRLAPVVPVLEGAVGLLLFAGVLPTIAAMAAAVLALAFVVVQLRELARGTHGGCRCFGAFDQDGGVAVPLLRAGVLLAGALWLSAGVGDEPLRLAVDAWRADATLVGAASGSAIVVGLSVMARTRRFEQWRRTNGALA